MTPNLWTVLETILILLVFAAVAGQLPPDVNESHYLTKAKHFWNPSWCPHDLFLESSFSHWLFYVAFGWLSKFLSLSAFAWTGRVLTWTALAFGWQRLSRSLIQIPLFSVLSAMFFLLLNERFHLAGEWIVGGFEAKGFAYAFVMLALAQLNEGKWQKVWPLLGVAALFHVLVGGWALLAAAFSFVLSVKPRQAKSISLVPVWQHARQHWLPIPDLQRADRCRRIAAVAGRSRCQTGRHRFGSFDLRKRSNFASPDILCFLCRSSRTIFATAAVWDVALLLDQAGFKKSRAAFATARVVCGRNTDHFLQWADAERIR